MSAEIGKKAFRKLGCHPGAIEGQRERSGAVWLLGALLARDEIDSVYKAGNYRGYPSRWWVMRSPQAPFLCGFDVTRIDEEDSGKLEVLDRITLNWWLVYARKILERIERWLAFGSILRIWETGQGMERMLEVYEAYAETRREYA